MDIALIAEGTYPFHAGGVSVWCDQLIRGLDPHRYQVVALCAGHERVVWNLPDNVTGLTSVPLWGPQPARRSPGPTVVGAFAAFMSSLEEPDPTASFEDALQALFELAQAGELAGGLSTEACVDAVLRFMAQDALPRGRQSESPGGAPSVTDAVNALLFLEHYLRPLAAEIPAVDLCHSAANGLGALVGLGAHWKRGTPFLLTEHGVYLRERYLSMGPGTSSQAVRSLLLRFFKHLSWAGYQAAAFVAPGSEYNRVWEEAIGARPEQIRPIHNGVDPLQFQLAAVEPEEPTLSWVGRIDPLKDVETLLRAFALVHQAMPEARLRIFGPTPKGNEWYLQRCVDLCRELGLDEVATFEGRVGSVLTAYHAGQVVVMTSISEGFPYVLIEAMAAGRPTVATSVGGCPEAAGDAGLIVPPRNPEAVAAACLRLLRDPELRLQVAVASRQRIVSQFTLEQSLALYGDLYREITGLSVSNVILEREQGRQPASQESAVEAGHSLEETSNTPPPHPAPAPAVPPDDVTKESTEISGALVERLAGRLVSPTGRDGIRREVSPAPLVVGLGAFLGPDSLVASDALLGSESLVTSDSLLGSEMPLASDPLLDSESLLASGSLVPPGPAAPAGTGADDAPPGRPLAEANDR